MTKKECFNVKGIHCPSCEVIIERKLGKVEGVEHVKVNKTKGTVEVDCSCDVSMEAMQNSLPETYTLSECKTATDKTEKFSIKDRWEDITLSLLILFMGYFVLSQFNLLPSNFGLSENMGYGFILILGLVASTSSCLAVSGGLLLAIAAKFNEQHKKLSGWQRFKPHIYFNVGRIVSYTVLGGVVGLIGSLFTLSFTLTGIVTIIASLFMVLIGLQLLHIFPFLNHIHIKMPKFIAHKIHDANEDEKSAYSNVGASLFGGLTFFLPCGFTQALQLYVLAKGDFMTGALVMLAFSIGTLPMLASLGAVSSFVKGNIQRYFMTFSAILVIVLGLFSIQYGFALLGTGPVDGPLGFQDTLDNLNNDQDFVKMVDGVQIAEMKVVGLEYTPHTFKVRAGIPVKWVIDGTQAKGCGQVITVPGLGITEYFTQDGPKTITFTPEVEGKIPFSCSMGMTTKGAAFEVVKV